MNIAYLSSLVVPGVLWALVLCSVISWSLLLVKGWQLIRLNRQNRRFLQVFWRAPSLAVLPQLAESSPGAMARIASAGFASMALVDRGVSQDLMTRIDVPDRLERSLRQQIHKERRGMEGGLAVLASIGSTAPFIGLFGTVWGIMEALKTIGLSGSASLETVAGPIGHALVATGVGIAVAVPAVLIYNYFLRNLKVSSAYLDDFAHDLYSLTQQSDFKL